MSDQGNMHAKYNLCTFIHVAQKLHVKLKFVDKHTDKQTDLNNMVLGLSSLHKTLTLNLELYFVSDSNNADKVSFCIQEQFLTQTLVSLLM